ncbi:MAG: hypothetical protein A2W90_11480 [Bacteroidetes bacterium GWF2_42_66]|nr:MAG: hypothetical protein A2W92_13485 [Bacteroidetes bacterium GWA2_42_15]OFY01803.1 MAG: hypothetical protein A2W89_23090 [Bacteroidetes bacterium GWE2_42_39]OFY44903.1 MAG: hypothetical protein A2W90_11480 [Bacteroidetes bacterium GWF2_42_66]HBL76030.1 hypothetical protein [Prolixibacteraceae bacterium]HCR89655.1 hypothetical protein [Prolixibacteraceae bacterium]
MEQVKNNKRIIGTVIGSAVGLIVVVLIQQLFFKTPAFDKMLMKVADELNANCPVMVDSETRLDNAFAMPGNVFQYNYTLVNLVKDSINIQDFEEYMKPRIVSNAKTNPDLQLFRDNKVTMNYYYKDLNGIFVSKISISPDQYSE